MSIRTPLPEREKNGAVEDTARPRSGPPQMLSAVVANRRSETCLAALAAASIDYAGYVDEAQIGKWLEAGRKLRAAKLAKQRR